MKKSVYFQAIDGFQIFSGIVSDPPIDPAKTIEQVNIAAAGHPVIKKIEDITGELKTELDKMSAAAKDAEISQKNSDKAALEKATILWNRSKERIKKLEVTLVEYSKELEIERERLFYEKAVYFNINNAVLMEENEANALLKKYGELNKRQALTIKGAVIPDWRNTAHWKKTKQENGNRLSLP